MRKNLHGEKEAGTRSETHALFVFQARRASLSHLGGHPGSHYGYSHYLQRAEKSPSEGGGESGTPISEQFPTAISIKPLNTSSLSN